MILGALAGSWLHAVSPPDGVTSTAAYEAFDGIARIFLNLLRMIVVPLVFFSLISGMLGMGDLSRFGRLGAKTFTLYIVTSLMAILTGLFLVNVIRPGAGLDLAIPTRAAPKHVPDSFWDVLVEMVPDNFVRAAADFDLIGVIIFALFFGAFTLTLEKGPKKETLVHLIQAAADVMMKLTGFIIALAPVGIAGLIARMVSTTGIGVFYDLRWYVVTVFVALAFHAFVTLPLMVFLATRSNPYRFLRVMSPAFLTGFSTASSSGTLAVTLERAEHGAGISNRVASFVLPIGATVNMDGTALYEIVTVLFIAQVHAGVDPAFSLSLGQQVLIVFLGLAVSIGAAGIPHAGLVMMVIILQAVGLPIEYTGLIWAVDRVLDMCRTATNIASDSCVTYIVASTEGEVDRSVMEQV